MKSCKTQCRKIKTANVKISNDNHGLVRTSISKKEAKEFHCNRKNTQVKFSEFLDQGSTSQASIFDTTSITIVTIVRTIIITIFFYEIIFHKKFEIRERLGIY